MKVSAIVLKQVINQLRQAADSLEREHSSLISLDQTIQRKDGATELKLTVVIGEQNYLDKNAQSVFKPLQFEGRNEA
jgi:hypothetical protein